MQALGMKGNQKLSDIMINQKYSPRQKQEAWVLEDREGILFLKDFRIAERVKITPDTQSVLALQVKEGSPS